MDAPKRPWHATLCLAVLGLGLGLAAAGEPGDAVAAEPAAEQMLVRLDELPPGYVVAENTFCGALRVEREALPQLAAFSSQIRSFSCQFQYERLYSVPDNVGYPPIIDAFTVTMKDPEAAARLLALAPELLQDLVLTPGFAVAGGAAPIGEETKLLHTLSARFRGARFLSGTAVAWRSGTVVSGVVAAGGDPESDDAAATELATVQQRHIEAPSPYLRGEGDDVPVYLSNPSLDVPVYWLGRTFEPKGIPQRSDFISAYGREELEGGLPGEQLVTGYTPALFLHTWLPNAWARFSKTPLARRQWSWACTRSRRVHLADGLAVIYASYKRGYPTGCPQRPPHHFSAHVFLPGAVVAIGPATCGHCQGDINSYESFAGLEAVVRALRRWPGSAAVPGRP